MSLTEITGLAQGNLFSEFTPMPGLGRARGTELTQLSELSLKKTAVYFVRPYTVALSIRQSSGCCHQGEIALLTHMCPSDRPHYSTSIYFNFGLFSLSSSLN